MTPRETMLRAMHAERLTQRVMAKRLGVTPRTVSSWLAKLGLRKHRRQVTVHLGLDEAVHRAGAAEARRCGITMQTLMRRSLLRTLPDGLEAR